MTQYRCAACQEVFESEQSHEEVMAISEALQEQSLEGQDLVVICESCHNDFVKWRMETGRQPQRRHDH